MSHIRKIHRGLWSLSGMCVPGIAVFFELYVSLKGHFTGTSEVLTDICELAVVSGNCQMLG